MYIITYATHSERYYPLLKKNGPDIINLGLDKKWNGWYYRIQAVIEFCEKLHPREVVCFIDGFDTLILSQFPESEALEKFHESNCEILFSADNVPAVSSHYSRFRIFGTCRDKLLSAGMYIGFAGAIKSFWTGIKEKDDDQQYATKVCRNNKVNTKIDTKYSIFLNFYSGKNIRFHENRIVVLSGSKNVMPVFLSGPGYQNLNHILLKIGYKKEELPVFDFDKKKEYYKNNIKTFWKYFLVDFAIVILVICLIVYIAFFVLLIL